MNIRKKQTKQTIKIGNHLYKESKDILNGISENLKEQSDKLAHKVNDEPVSFLLIAVGVGFVLSGIILSKLRKE